MTPPRFSFSFKKICHTSLLQPFAPPGTAMAPTLFGIDEEWTEGLIAARAPKLLQVKHLISSRNRITSGFRKVCMLDQPTKPGRMPIYFAGSVLDTSFFEI